MYEQFFGLRERPFDLTPNPRYLVLTESHLEVLRNLEYGIGSKKGITLLTGEAGSGKTTVIRAAIERQPLKVHCVHLNNPMLTRDEFVEMLAVSFGLSEAASRSKAAMLIELERLLLDRRERDETTTLIMDEAQSLPLDLLEELRLLANIETNDEKLMSVIIAGQPEIATRLNEQSLRQFKQRVALRCQLRSLTPIETAAYVAGSPVTIRTLEATATCAKCRPTPLPRLPCKACLDSYIARPPCLPVDDFLRIRTRDLGVPLFVLRLITLHRGVRPAQ